jgi:hypothetical protein
MIAWREVCFLGGLTTSSAVPLHLPHPRPSHVHHDPLRIPPRAPCPDWSRSELESSVPPLGSQPILQSVFGVPGDFSLRTFPSSPHSAHLTTMLQSSPYVPTCRLPLLSITHHQSEQEKITDHKTVGWVGTWFVRTTLCFLHFVVTLFAQ